MSQTSTVDLVVSLAKRRGFVFPCGEIYGGTRSAWDYGPLGVALKENIKRQWWRSMVQTRDDVVGLDSSIILPRQTWEASGHVATFSDPLTECQSCHHRFRADHLQEQVAEKESKKGNPVSPDAVELTTVGCPNCGTSSGSSSLPLRAAFSATASCMWSTRKRLWQDWHSVSGSENSPT